jgi:hypothetical protein
MRSHSEMMLIVGGGKPKFRLSRQELLAGPDCNVNIDLMDGGLELDGAYSASFSLTGPWCTGVETQGCPANNSVLFHCILSYGMCSLMRNPPSVAFLHSDRRVASYRGIARHRADDTSFTVNDDGPRSAVLSSALKTPV